MKPGTTGGRWITGILAVISLLLAATAVPAQSPSCPDPPIAEISDLSLSGDEPAQFRRILETIEEARGVEIDSAGLAAGFVRLAGCLGNQRPPGAGPLIELLGDVELSADDQTFAITSTTGETRRIRLASTPAHRTARRMIRHLEKEADRRGIDRSAVRRAGWFLMTEACIDMLDGSYNHYTYADQLVFSIADKRGKSFRPGFVPVLAGEDVLVHEVIDTRLAEAGLAPGDRVLTMDGRPLSGRTLLDWYGRWFREQPFDYTITVHRDGGPARLAGRSIAHRHRTLQWMIHERTAYVRVRRFTAGTLEEFRRLLRRTSREDVHGLVIDLRNNGGGVQQFGLVDIFFTPTQTVASSRHFSANETDHYTGSVEYCGLPLALLVNRSSASMAEVFAAAVKQHGRGTLVGETTFGKGVGQHLHDVGTEGRLALVDRTLFYPGTDESWDGSGITPHVAVAIDETEREAVDAFLAGEDLVLTEQLTADTALRRAIQILKEEP